MILSEAMDRFIPDGRFCALAPLIQDVSQAAGLSALADAAQAAAQALGFRYFAFATGLKRAADTPFKPILSSLPKTLLQSLWEQQVYRSNPVLEHIRLHNTGVVVDFGRLPPGATADKVRQLLGPYSVSGAVVTPVVSATQDLSVIAGYLTQQDPSADDLAPLAMLGNALSIKLLTLHNSATPSSLTETQREILKWAAAGKSAGDIATIVGLTRRGCEYHLGEIYRKLGVASRTQAVAAFARGIA